MTTEHYKGQRLSFSSQLCTVRYIGNVDGASGEWLGVEWDDPSRGKHSGEHDGVRYFRCKSQHPTAGSFVRPNRPNDKPVSFSEALRQKYAPEDSIANGGIESQMSNKPIILGGKVVEEVGFDKIRRQQALLRELRVVLLDGCCVAGLTSDARARDRRRRKQAIEDISKTCPNIVELDLSRNLIERWEEVAGICGQLKRLKSLRLNGNRFSDLHIGVENNVDALTSPFNTVNDLSLDENLLSWEEITSLVDSFPSLSTLSASSNDLSSLRVNLNSANLTKVVLEENNFTSLSALSPLCKLPTLQSLYLGHNSINGGTNSHTSNFEDIEPKFPRALTYLDLSYNAIDNWDFINRLQYHFPGLTGLRVAHNPLYEDKDGNPTMGVEESFMLTLARLPGLKILNFSNITVPERTNAEMYYLSGIAKELEAVLENQEDQVLQHHPRYSALCEMYGPPTINRHTINPNSLSARLIQFSFTFSKSSSPPDQAPISTTKVHRLPRSFDIYRLKGIVGKLFGLRPNRIKLIWETGEWDPVSGFEAEDEEISVGSEEDEEDVETVEEDKGRWVARDIELLDGIRDVGYWIEGKEARVRVELR